MNRWVRLTIWALLGLVLLGCGWLVPAYLKAVDPGVVRESGRKSMSAVERGLAVLDQKQVGAAQLLLQASEQQGVPMRETLAARHQAAVADNARLAFLGCPDTLTLLDKGLPDRPGESFTAYVLRLENRARLLARVEASKKPGVDQLLESRRWTNTFLLPPSESSSGQTFDAAVTIAGLLMESGQVPEKLGEALAGAAVAGHRAGSSEVLESAYLDLLSLGQRFNWGQLTGFLRQVDSLETLRRVTVAVRQHEGKLAVLYAAVDLSGQPAAVGQYLARYPKNGMEDLALATGFGAGGLAELLKRQAQVHRSKLRAAVLQYEPFAAFYHLAVGYCRVLPGFGLASKFTLYFLAGFCLAAAAHYGRKAVSVLEQPLQVRGFHFAREFLFGVGLCFVMVLVSEPFITQDTRPVDFPIKLRLPTMGSVAAAVAGPGAFARFMNPMSLITLVLFFVLQSLIYTACLVKLAEIRRQNVPPRIKLRLLENEDHLFDAGLYVGFVGTIISLILVSLNVIQPSIMAAYSSTSFGIIFVSAFKIFNLRPLRRKLLLESEATYQTSEPAATHARS